VDLANRNRADVGRSKRRARDEEEHYAN